MKRGDEHEVVQQVQNPADVKFILGRPLQRPTECFENFTRTGITKGETFVVVKTCCSMRGPVGGNLRDERVQF